MSPAGSMSKSLSSPQQNTTSSYNCSSKSLPNTILSLTVAFWIHGCAQSSNLPATVTDPLSLGMTPLRAQSSDDFPDPIGPSVVHSDSFWSLVDTVVFWVSSFFVREQIVLHTPERNVRVGHGTQGDWQEGDMRNKNVEQSQRREDISCTAQTSTMIAVNGQKPNHGSDTRQRHRDGGYSISQKLDFQHVSHFLASDLGNQVQIGLLPRVVFYDFHAVEQFLHVFDSGVGIDVDTTAQFHQGARTIRDSA
ncbi:hypothetical protein OGAPHI_005886 [Ogataea philodendri]|uniref:Uncharacterized protein n=1 Tax=Ogataea philodendri TaxID=1378263 RepID=A0A9P8P039_9ASCO|nr:uncharacterized protein OGAPHI_005886 [Ogataea philodendri]KAH3662634.1 hypothetical protein OGAPHI_005886 [Ogataea philodendri]